MRGNPNDSLTPVGPWVRAESDILHVTIGRNVGTNTRHDDGSWSDFQLAVVGNLSALLKPVSVFGPFLGSGSWTDAETGELVTEESAHFSIIPGYTAKVSDVESILSDLAARFGQDAIAFSFGPARLAHRS